MSASCTFISPNILSPSVGTAPAPTLIDGRTDENFSADPHRFLAAFGARDDLEQLNADYPLYHAFYRWCRDGTKETHNWPTKKVR
ncbi:hypothetical protein ACTGJ9_030025 [Bradyrhizobium sp. RDM12]